MMRLLLYFLFSGPDGPLKHFNRIPFICEIFWVEKNISNHPETLVIMCDKKKYYLKSPGECGRRRVRFDDVRPKWTKIMTN